MVTTSPEYRPRQWYMESGCCPHCMASHSTVLKWSITVDYIWGRLGCRICQKVAMVTANRIRGSILLYLSIFLCFPNFQIKCCIPGLKLKINCQKIFFLFIYIRIKRHVLIKQNRVYHSAYTQFLTITERVEIT